MERLHTVSAFAAFCVPRCTSVQAGPRDQHVLRSPPRHVLSDLRVCRLTFETNIGPFVGRYLDCLTKKKLLRLPFGCCLQHV